MHIVFRLKCTKDRVWVGEGQGGGGWGGYVKSYVL